MANAVLAERPEGTGERTDHQLVSAVRRGDDRAFEQLYSRYQHRIAAYVCGMVKDYGRAEDITQEVFVSALRRMRETERPIAFKPWIYEIAKNACIDAYRRSRRTEEVSFEADDRLSPSDHVRLVANGPEPDAAVDAKLELDNLCGAFGGLSDSHHEILVMRELEGRSYKDIGERMGMSRPAVESTLFRARKRLGEEYDELASGARCLHVQAIIAGDGQSGRRDQRKLARHLSHCQPCRRLAASAGLDVPVPVRRRIAEKLAGLLPLPIFLRGRRGGGEEAASAFGGSGGAWMVHAPSFAEAMSSGWSKGAAGLAALLLTGAGAGVGVNKIADSGKHDERGTGYQATDAPAAPARGGATTTPGGETFKVRERSASERRAADARPGASQRRGGEPDRASSDGGGPAGAGAGAGAGGAAGSDGGGSGSAGGAAGGGGNAGAKPDGGGPVRGGAPPVSLPQAGPRAEAPKAPAVDPPSVPAPNIKETTDKARGAVPGVAEQVQSGGPQLPSAPNPAPAVPKPPAPELPKPPVPVPDAVSDAAAPVTGAVDDAADDLLDP